jgi:hypothetical protein
MKKWFLFPVLAVLISCNQGSSIFGTRPPGVLNKSEMIDLLVDINLAESALRVGTPAHIQASDSLYQKSQFIQVFKDHEVTPGEFDKSLSYYSEHVDDLNEIYLEVIDKLATMQAESESKSAKKTAPLKKKEE